jgi:hypothetical protein
MKEVVIRRHSFGEGILMEVGKADGYRIAYPNVAERLHRTRRFTSFVQACQWMQHETLHSMIHDYRYNAEHHLHGAWKNGGLCP